MESAENAVSTLEALREFCYELNFKSTNFCGRRFFNEMRYKYLAGDFSGDEVATESWNELKEVRDFSTTDFFVILCRPAFAYAIQALRAYNRKELEKSWEFAAEARYYLGMCMGSSNGGDYAVKIKQNIAARKPRTDALQELIIDFTKKRPKISVNELRHELEKLKGFGIIEDVDEDAIWFNNKHNQLDQAKVTGLKDRLSRAKKLIMEIKEIALTS
jgi:hypothetical protein